MNTQNTQTQVYYEPCKTAALIAKLEAQLEKTQRQLRMSERTIEHLFRERDQVTAQRDELLALIPNENTFDNANSIVSRLVIAKAAIANATATPKASQYSEGSK